MPIVIEFLFSYAYLCFPRIVGSDILVLSYYLHMTDIRLCIYVCVGCCIYFMNEYLRQRTRGVISEGSVHVV